MAIVARGLGQPEDGAIVVGGLGTVEVDPNAMSATLSGSGSIVATLTATASPPTTSTGGGAGIIRRPRPVELRPRAIRTREISARLSAAGRLNASITFTVDFDAELEQLLLVGVI